MKRPLFPLQYEYPSPITYDEVGIEKGAKADSKSIENPEVFQFFETVKSMSLKDTLRWINQHKDTFPDSFAVVDFTIDDKYRLKNAIQGGQKQLLIVKRPLNTIRHLNTFLAASNAILANGGYIWCNCHTSLIQKETILTNYPIGINWIVYLSHYLWHRVCSKLWATKELYFQITKGKKRAFSRVEVLGRFYRAGFKVIHEDAHQNCFFVIAQQFREPISDDIPSGAPIIKLNRVGKDGNLIGVYKFRTMYSYSEYIQDYVYEHNSLQEGGKFANDYRINIWGKILRAIWLDEFPMFANIIKGQMKLVGVRPLSRHYYSLYTPEMQQLRIKTKPGLLPPFYYEKKTPVTLDEIQDSERRYIEAYLKHPFRTDWKYFWGIVGNIIFKKKRSA